MPKQAPAVSQQGAGGTEALFAKLSDALQDADYKKCIKLADSGTFMCD
jgi:hypothetical protein